MNQNKEDIRITEEVARTASKNQGSGGKELITLLLNQNGEGIKITKGAVKEAAENTKSGKKMMTLLFSQKERI